MNNVEEKKEELIEELVDIRQRMSELNRSAIPNKLTEEEPMKSEEHYRNLVEVSPDMIALHSRRKYVYMNPAGIKMLRAAGQGDLIGRSIFEIIHPEWLEMVRERISQLEQGKGVALLEEKYIGLDGTIVDVEVAASPIFFQGERMVQVIARDITERKRAEEALRESERQAQQSAREKATLSEIARIISSTFSIEEVYKLFSEEVKKLISFDRITVTLVSQEGNPLVNRYVEGTSAPGKDQGSTFSREGTATAGVIQGQRGLIFNPQEESEVDSLFPALLPEFRAGLRSLLSVPLISRDQPIGALHLHSRIYKAYSEGDLNLAESIANQIAGAIANAQLFSELKRTEEALRRSELFLRDVLDTLPISVSITDKNGKVLLNNPARNKTWGGEEFKGISQLGKYKGWWADTGEKVEEDEWGLARAVKEGKTSLNRMMHIETFDGQKKTILNSGVPIRDKSGEVIGAISVNQDITELKRVESQVKKLLQSVSEKQEELRALGVRLAEVDEEERRRLARELHDRVGQNLTALGINLNILCANLPAEGAAKTSKFVEDSLRLVTETVGDIRNLMAELRPPVLDEYGLLAALRWYGEQFSERTGVATAIRGDDRMQRLSSSKEIALFRIAQEALTNVAKHARASHVTVTLERVDEKTVMSLADDGVGFDNRGYPSQGKPTSWGLITIRERAEAIGGQVKIESEPGKGTRIIVELRK